MGLVNFTVLKSDFAEDLGYDKYQTALDYCIDTALHKVEDISSKLNSGKNDIPKGTVLIGADTIVEIDGKILEKPRDFDDAYRMMSMLSGRYQTVHTAVILFSNGAKSSTNSQLSLVSKFAESTRVKFVDLTDEDIRAYIESREGFDKAGGYGIQGLGGQMVERIDGCYFNVMGLPITALSRELARLYRAEKI
jgi:septum formation protein